MISVIKPFGKSQGYLVYSGFDEGVENCGVCFFFLPTYFAC
jgi:hypothetical protein